MTVQLRRAREQTALWELKKQPAVQNWISEVDQSRVAEANKVSNIKIEQSYFSA